MRHTNICMQLEIETTKENCWFSSPEIAVLFIYTFNKAFNIFLRTRRLVA